MSDDIAARLRSLTEARFGPKAASLGDQDDMFEGLGIDSLQALDLLSDLEDAFGIEVPDYELQGVNTLGGLAEVIRRRR